jgi:hypothetical protein
MLSQISLMIEPVGLQIGAGGGDLGKRDFRQCGLGQDIGGDASTAQSAIS